MAQQNFSATVDQWVRETKERMEAVFKESAQRVISDMQEPVGAGGNMPVDTGFLRASLRASVNEPSMSFTFRPDEGGAYRYEATQVALTIAGADLGDTIYAVYSANYAHHVEYGAQGRAPRAFVRLAAQKWPQIVNQVALEARSR
ncbi:hypothetical protein [Hyphomonas sp. UBA4494]|jgi:hypothetical protein|uniref:hypothetical protein n=1 Tax=Hyphomonas sp. UBA4494 TaxID=1946631 RepID=UPI0025C3E07F|nr:hypothetical protein [Hyphomonas sp. UBA4494]